MARQHRLWRACVALALVVSVGACGTADKTAADPGFAGHWTSTQWGEHYIVIEGSTVKIVYAHDNGRAVGTLDGDTFTGWWTETPSRRPSADAGEVTFTLTRIGDQRTIDGTWRYGSEGTARDNWDLVWVDAVVPAEVTATFTDAAAFIAHP